MHFTGRRVIDTELELLHAAVCTQSYMYTYACRCMRAYASVKYQGQEVAVMHIKFMYVHNM